MAAFGALIRGDLPPVGSPIDFDEDRLSPDSVQDRLPQFDGYLAIALDSGTSALALAMVLARQLRPELTAPEVILPGYGCPDLVAAAEFAGLKPVLVDTDVDDPGYAPAGLERAFNSNTLLVVAVNFLGIRERIEDIRALAGERGVLVVEDNAQWFPEPCPGLALTADFVLTSFGRGKPVSMLGGGLLWVRRSTALTLEQLQAPVGAAAGTRYLGLRIKLFNILLNPRLYVWLNRNPLLTLGETAYHPLEEIASLDDQRLRQLAHCLKRYQQQSVAVERYYEERLRQVCAGTDLPSRVGPGRRGRLLRYPLICRDQPQRDRLLTALQSRGLGATAMYKTVLPAIDGVGDRVRVDGELANARRFAECLITLPTHTGVTAAHRERVVDTIADHWV